MSDAHLTAPSDNTQIPALRDDSQVSKTASTKFLDEIRVAMTGPADVATMTAEKNATTDLLMLSGDPQQNVVLNAIADRIEKHDPALGLVQGSVERDRNGEVTAFTFTNHQQEAAYATSLNSTMDSGATLKEAIDSNTSNMLNREGVLKLSYLGQAQY
jgi:hypothetical protein